MYLIIKDVHGGYPSPYMGAVVDVNGIPWFVTGLACPTVYEDIVDANKVITGYRKRWPGEDFNIMSDRQYLDRLKKDGRLLRYSEHMYMGGQCKWIQEFIEKVKD